MEKKANWQAFKKILDQHGITKLYHFTDRANLESIIKHGGLYSWADCESRGITIPKPGGSDTSHDLDRRDGLQNYVRVSFTPEHPMMYVAKDDGRISDPVVLEIDPEVIYWKGSKYADRNATKTGAMVGGALDNFKRIHFSSVKAHKHFELPEDEQQFFQAEVLVKNFIPINYISIPLKFINNAYISTTSSTENLEDNNKKMATFSPVITSDLKDEEISTRVTRMDIKNGLKDEYGTVYSADGQRLLKVPNEIQKFIIQAGTKVICDNAFYNPPFDPYGPLSLTERIIMMNSSSSNLTNITIPDTIKTIGYKAFYECTHLSSINIPNSVRSICSEAFAMCSDLKNIIFSKSLKHIGENALDGTKWFDNQPDGIIYIGQLAYKYKGDMPHNTKITIKNGTNCIEDFCFNGCKGLTTIIIPDSITKIGSAAFKGCSLMYITIPDSVKQIGTNSFADCKELSFITIGKSVTNIGKNAFEGCTGLTSVDIKNSLIGNGQFLGCTSLVNVNISNCVTSIDDWAFSGCNKLTSISIPDSVTIIGKGAFQGCTNLKSIIIPNSVTKIGDKAFYGCTSLAKITIPESVTEIGEEAFSKTAWFHNQPDGLIYAGTIAYRYKGTINYHLSIEEGTMGISGGCFSGYKLFHISIPTSLSRINIDAFNNSSPSKITVIQGNKVFDSRDNCNAIIETITNKLIIGCHFTVIPNSITEIGERAFEQVYFINKITIPNSVKEIGKSAFQDCSGLIEIAIPDSVKEIGESAFQGCSLTTITYGNSLIRIGKSAFQGCRDLRETTIPDSVKEIGESAFQGCNSLTNLTISNSVKEIEKNAFSGCKNLSKVTIGNSVTQIKERTFSNCKNLKTVTIGHSVKTIGFEAFLGCFDLNDLPLYQIIRQANRNTSQNKRNEKFASLIIPDSVTEIESNAFKGCKSLAIINIPNSVKIIKRGAFTDTAWFDDQPNGLVYAGLVAYKYKGNMPNGTIITLNYGTISISENCFSNCNGLTSISIPQTVISIGDSAFENCNNLVRLIIPGSIVSIGDNAFKDCNNLSLILIPKGTKEKFKKLINNYKISQHLEEME